MSAVLSIVVALVMAFNLSGGIMSEMESPVSFEAKAQMNAEAITAMVPELGEESQAQILQLAADIVNNIGFRTTAYRQTVEASMTAGEDTIINIGLRNAEDGITLASSLIEGITLNLSAETVNSLMEQMTAEQGMDQMNELVSLLTEMDQETIVSAFLTSMDHAVDAVKEKAGETETGSFTVDEFEFTTKTPVDMNDQEIETVLVNMMKEYLSQESFQKIFALLGEENNPLTQLDSTLEDIQNRPEDEELETTVILYGNEDGEEYVSVDLRNADENGKEEASAHLGFGVEFKCHRLNGEYMQNETNPSIVSCNIVNAESNDVLIDIIDPSSGQEVFINLVKSEGMPMSGVVGVRAGGMFIRAILDTETDEERTACHARILCTPEGGNAEEAQDLELGTIDVSWGKGGEITSVFDGDSVKTIAVEPLIQGEGQDDLAELYTSAMGGVMKALSTLIAHLPEESGAMINSLLSGMMGAATSGQ